MTDLNQSYQSTLDVKEYKSHDTIKQKSSNNKRYYNLKVYGADSKYYRLPYIQLRGAEGTEYKDDKSGKWIITTTLEIGNLMLELQFINFADKIDAFMDELDSFNLRYIKHCPLPLENIDFPAIKVICLYEQYIK